MRIIRAFALIVLPWLLPAMPLDEKKPPAKSAPAKVAGQVPPGAKEIEPGVWRHTDDGGKAWIYRRTPFGITRTEERPPEEANLPEGMKAAEDGELIRFERPSPFGPVKWTKKKSEKLNELEQRVWERDRPKPPASEQPAAKPAAKD